jgi:hypothetical protein
MARGHFWRWIKRAVILTLGIFAAAYAADYVSFSYHFPASRTLLSTIEINVFYRIPHADCRFEVSEGDPESQVCAHTLFSHAGYPPCWRTKHEKWIDLPVLLK